MSEIKQRKNDEIDLRELFSAIWKGIVRFFKVLFDFLLYLFVFGLWRIHWLFLIALIGASAGYLVYKSTERYYYSEMIAQPNGFTSIDMVHYIDDIHEMCLKKNFAGIAEALMIDPGIADLILDLAAYHFIDEDRDGIGDYIDYEHKYEASDTNETIVLNRILISAKVHDNSIFDDVRMGLIRHINNIPYLVKVNELRKAELIEMISYADKEIQKLDSLQNVEYYLKNEGKDGLGKGSGQIVILNENPTQLYYQDKAALLNQRLSYQRALELATDPITIIKGFSELQSEEDTLPKYLLKYGFVFGLAGYIFFLFLFYRKPLMAYLVSKK